MSVAVLPQSPQEKRSKRLLTIADVAALPDELPTGSVRYELNNGELLIMPPAADDHGVCESNVVTELKIQGERRGHGQVRSGDSGLILWRNPDRLVGIDAGFVAKNSLPVRRSREGYLETIPDLIVEIRSK